MSKIQRILQYVALCCVLTCLSGSFLFADWSENFDDGDISDWIIENPDPPGASPIEIDLDSSQCISDPYSFKIYAPIEFGSGGRATGPDPLINAEARYVIEFHFKWFFFHYYYLVVFRQVCIVIDYPSLPISYKDNTGRHFLSGTPPFEYYCPPFQWTHFKIVVEPAESIYTIYVNGDSLGVVCYHTFNSGAQGFRFGDPAMTGSDGIHGYYDDIVIYQSPVDRNESRWGMGRSLYLRCCPNPSFGDNILIRYGIPENSDLKITVYNVCGSEVKTLVDRRVSAGNWTVSWDGNDEYGKKISPGIYILKMDWSGRTEIEELVIMPK